MYKNKKAVEDMDEVRKRLSKNGGMMALDMLKNYFKDKGIGFYVTLGGILLSLVTLIVYTSHYGHGPLEANIDSMSWAAFGFILAGIIAAIALIVFKQYFWASVASAACMFLAFMFFIYGVYPYVSVVMVGIDIQEFSAGFIGSTVLYALSVIVTIAGMYFKPVKD